MAVHIRNAPHVITENVNRGCSATDTIAVLAEGFDIAIEAVETSKPIKTKGKNFSMISPFFGGGKFFVVFLGCRADASSLASGKMWEK